MTHKADEGLAPERRRRVPGWQSRDVLRAGVLLLALWMLLKLLWFANALMLTVFLDSPDKALAVAIAYGAIQFLENHLLIPLLMKGGVNLPPALTLVSQALMALIFGFLGLMVAVPLVAAILVPVKMLYVEDVV